MHVLVRDLMKDQAFAGGSVHHEHRELGPSALEPMKVGQLRVRIGTEDVLQPSQRADRPLEGQASAPRFLISGPIQHVDRQLGW